MIVLDTDLISILQGGSSAAKGRLLENLDRARLREPVHTTIITYEEQVRGWFKVLADARSMTEQLRAYRLLRQHVEYYASRTLEEFDEPAAVEFQRLKGLKVRIGTLDLRIAAITISRKATLWSRNLRDFRQVPGLALLDPTT